MVLSLFLLKGVEGEEWRQLWWYVEVIQIGSVALRPCPSLVAVVIADADGERWW